MSELKSKSNADKFLEAWHHAIREKNLDLMHDWVTDDVVLYSPAIFIPKKGRSEVEPLLRDVLAVFEGYHVTKTWIDGDEILLEFEARVNEKQLQGIDRISLTPEGKMRQLKVMIRPYNGLVTLMKAVVQRSIDRIPGSKKWLAKALFFIKTR